MKIPMLSAPHFFRPQPSLRKQDYEREVMKSRKPDYRLKVLNKDTEERGEIGAGWKNDDGSISIVLNPCINLQASKNIVLTLFPPNKL